MIETNNTISNLKITECSAIFLAILLKYLIIHSISKTVLYVFIICISIFTIFIIIKQKFKKNELLKISILIVICFYFVIFYNDINFYISFLLAMICLKKENKTFIKVFLVSSSILYCSNILLNMLGVLSSHNMIRNTPYGTIIRNDLGFGHPNQVFLFFLPIVFSGYYLYGNKKVFYLVSIILSYILYMYSNCRTGFMCVILMLGMGWLQSFKGLLIKNKSLLIAFLVFTLLSIVMALKFGESYDNWLNNILSNRLYYWNLYLNNNDVFSIIGHNINDKWYIDNFYLYLLIEYGLIGYTIYYIIYYLSIKRILPDYKLCLILFVFLVYGLFETNVIIGSIQFVFAIQLKYLIRDDKKIGVNYEKS